MSVCILNRLLWACIQARPVENEVYNLSMSHPITTIEEGKEEEEEAKPVEKAFEEPAKETESKTNSWCFGLVSCVQDKHWADED